MWRGEGVGVKVLVVDVVENAGVVIGAWCTSTTKHHQVATSGKLLMSKQSKCRSDRGHALTLEGSRHMQAAAKSAG